MQASTQLKTAVTASAEQTSNSLLQLCAETLAGVIDTKTNSKTKHFLYMIVFLVETQPELAATSTAPSVITLDHGWVPVAKAAVGRIKRSVQSGWEVPFESALAIERELQQQLFESDDAREGLDAYVEKRKPNFAGK